VYDLFGARLPSVPANLVPLLRQQAEAAAPASWAIGLLDSASPPGRLPAAAAK
jgi:hypothetical protein